MKISTVKKILFSIFLLLLGCASLSTHVTTDRATYITLQNLNGKFSEQAAYILDLVEKYPGKESYQVKWKNPLEIKLIYSPKIDSIVVLPETGEPWFWGGNAQKRLLKAKAENTDYDLEGDINYRRGGINYLMQPWYINK